MTKLDQLKRQDPHYHQDGTFKRKKKRQEVIEEDENLEHCIDWFVSDAILLYNFFIRRCTQTINHNEHLKSK